jgi:uncharacterized protein YjdB
VLRAGAGAVNFTITSGSQTVTGSIPVTVSAPVNASPVTSVSVNPTSLTLVPGGSGQLVATVTLSPTAPTTTNTGVTWSTSDATVATVDANGRVTALAGAAGRTAVITATAVANTALKASAAITVGPASSLVSGLSASPSAVTLQTGGTQQITSNVTLAAGAPAGTSTGVTYTSSDTSIAKVSSTGLITAGSRSGVATITISSVAAPTVTQTVGVTVQTPAPVRLTIQGLTVTNAAGNQVAADPTNVAGNLVATLNLDPGDFAPDSVVVTLGNQRTVCQRFSAQLQEAYRRALQDGSADVAPIQCLINTAQFNTTTGAALVQNGQQLLNATVFYRPQGGGTATTQTATIGQQLVLNNQSGYFVQVTNTPTAAQAAVNATGQATGPQGVLWRAGSITVSALPVFFTAPQGQTGSQTITVSLNDAVSGQIATKQATAAAGAAFSVTFGGQSAPFAQVPNNTVAGCDQCLDGYTSPNAGATPINQAGGTAGTQVVIGGGANTVFLNNSGVPQATGPVIYVDNTQPEPRNQFVGPAFLLSSVGTSGFLNGTFNFSSVQQSAATTQLADYNGVDRVAATFFYALANAGLTASQIVAANQPAATATGAINIPANPTADTYVLAAALSDALGNSIALPVTATAGGGNFTFGVSTAAPTLSVALNGSTSANNVQNGIFVTTPRIITGTVTSPVGFGRNPLLVTVTRVSPNGTFCAAANSPDVVVNAAPTADVIVSATAASNGAACPTVAAGSVSIDPTTAAEGIYTVTVQARDVAGNVSGTTTRTFTIDRTAPAVSGAVPLTVPLRGGQPATFQASATDNIALASSFGLVNYGSAVMDINLGYPGTTIGNVFAAPFTRTANLQVTVPALIRGLAVQPGVSTQNNNAFSPINAVAVGVLDAGNNVGYGVIGGTAINALLDPSQVAPVIFGGNGLQSLDLRFTPNNTTTTSAAAPLTLNSATTGNPTAVTITLRQNGLANTPFVSPFTRIELYRAVSLPQSANGVIPTGTTPTTQYQLVGTFSTGGLTVTPTTSQILSTFTVTPGTAGTVASIPGFPSAGNTTAVNLLVVASDANGYAVAIPVPTISLTNP